MGTTLKGTAGRLLEKALGRDLNRTTDIIEMRGKVWRGRTATYKDIGKRFDISKQRVHQILKKNGVAGTVVTKDPSFLTSTEAAKYLNVSYRSIRDWAVTGTLSHYQKRNGKIHRLLFRKEDLDTFRQEKLLTRRKALKENRGLKPLVIRLLELGEHPQVLAKLSGVGITTVYQWYYAMPGRDKRVGVALGKILSDEKMNAASAPNLSTGVPVK